LAQQIEMDIGEISVNSHGSLLAVITERDKGYLACSMNCFIEVIVAVKDATLYESMVLLLVLKNLK
jgi:hypothetical protein